jgi:hypothetical protein
MDTAAERIFGATSKPAINPKDEKNFDHDGTDGTHGTDGGENTSAHNICNH